MELEISPEPGEDEREAISAVLRAVDPAGRQSASPYASAWRAAALREGVLPDPGEDPGSDPTL